MYWVLGAIVLITIASFIASRKFEPPPPPVAKTMELELIALATGEFDIDTGEITETGVAQAEAAAEDVRGLTDSSAIVLLPDPWVTSYRRQCYDDTSFIIAEKLNLKTDEDMKSSPRPHTLFIRLLNPYIKRADPYLVMSYLSGLSRHPDHPEPMVLVVDRSTLSGALRKFPDAPKVELGMTGPPFGSVYRVKVTISPEGDLERLFF